MVHPDYVMVAVSAWAVIATMIAIRLAGRVRRWRSLARRAQNDLAGQLEELEQLAMISDIQRRLPDDQEAVVFREPTEAELSRWASVSGGTS